MNTAVLQSRVVGHTAHVNNVVLKSKVEVPPSQCEQCTISKRVVLVWHSVVLQRTVMVPESVWTLL